MMICKNCNLEKDNLHYKNDDDICNTCYRKELKFRKTCNKCKVRVEINLFTNDKRICDNCLIIKDKEINSGKKLCNKCNLEKDINRFNKNICYDCYNINRKDRISKGLSKKYPNSREIMKKWREKNKERLREYRKNYSKYKYHNDINYKLKVICRSFVRRALCSKKQNTRDILGYDIIKLKSRLEYQFTKEMNWNNYGIYWNIDHRKPISLFLEGTPLSIINALCNLKPVLKEYNFSKGNKFID
jgi:hypothetical protein